MTLVVIWQVKKTTLINATHQFECYTKFHIHCTSIKYVGTCYIWLKLALLEHLHQHLQVLHCIWARNVAILWAFPTSQANFIEWLDLIGKCFSWLAFPRREDYHLMFQNQIWDGKVKRGFSLYIITKTLPIVFIVEPQFKCCVYLWGHNPISLQHVSF